MVISRCCSSRSRIFVLRARPSRLPISGTLSTLQGAGPPSLSGRYGAADRSIKFGVPFWKGLGLVGDLGTIERVALRNGGGLLPALFGSSFAALSALQFS